MLVRVICAMLIALPTVAMAEKWRDPVYKDMFNQPSYKYGEAPRNMPKDSVPLKGRKIIPGKFDLPAMDAIANPISTQTDLAHGQFLFETYCGVCHGGQGKGDGKLMSKGIVGPDITGDYYKGKTDGFFWVRILRGGALMPAYNDSMSTKEAWEVVNYVRSLQNK